MAEGKAKADGKATAGSTVAAPAGGPAPNRYRSHTCGALREADVGQRVHLSGWVHNVRDLGGLLFIDLRDHYGITQIVTEPDSAAFKAMEKARKEWVIRIEGDVKQRSPETVNDKLATGRVEVYVRGIEILSEAKDLPVPVFGEPEYPEDLRLQYRFLDLRRETLHANIMKRQAIVSSIRRRMEAAGFFEFTTPILTASSPEGARDFLVPSRIHPGKFYALPQAPQQYKQLLMVSGFDRYFQIAPCFRDEDPRADRLPGEFYQLDVEMSFVEQEDIWRTMEPIITGVMEEFAGPAEGGQGKTKPVTQTWPRIPYDEAIRKYGSDKPDLRNPIEMQDVSEHFRGSGFKVFARMLEDSVGIKAGDDIKAGGAISAEGHIQAGGQISAGGGISAGGQIVAGLAKKAAIWAIPAPGGGSRAFCDRMNAWAQSEGQPGLGYIMWRAEEGPAGAGPVAKNIGAERAGAIMTQLGLKVGDAAFFTAGDPAKFHKFAGSARDKVGAELKLVREDQFALAWIVDFPFYEWNEDEKKIDFSHNPFSMPQGGLEALNAATTDEAKLALKANQYDIVCNGFEIASGSVRNHRPDTMVKAFEITGLSKADVEARFGGLYRAFQYGAPPHGGMAAGIDRMVMLLVGAKNLREISLFPMNQQAADLLMGAPSEVMPKQLRELSIRVIAEPPKSGAEKKA